MRRATATARYSASSLARPISNPLNIAPPGGVWDGLEVRRHRVQQLVGTVTQTELIDEVALPVLAGGFEQALDELCPLEQEETALIREVQELAGLITQGDPTGTLTEQVAAQRQTVAWLVSEQRLASRRLDDEELSPFNYYAEINPGTGSGVRLHFIPGSGLSLRQRDGTDAQLWKLQRVAVSATGRTVVCVFPRTDQSLALRADNSGSGTYTGVSVIPLQPVPNLVYQTWSLEFLEPGNPAQVQLRIRQPDSINPSLDSYLLVVLANGKLGAEPVESFVANGSTGDWFLFNTQIPHDAGRAAIAAARDSRDAVAAELAAAAYAPRSTLPPTRPGRPMSLAPASPSRPGAIPPAASRSAASVLTT
jgi:hypothetical protein